MILQLHHVRVTELLFGGWQTHGNMERLCVDVAFVQEVKQDKGGLGQ